MKLEPQLAPQLASPKSNETSQQPTCFTTGPIVLKIKLSSLLKQMSSTNIMKIRSHLKVRGEIEMTWLKQRQNCKDFVD